MYCLKILTDVEKQGYLFYPGPELKVTELRVEVPAEIIEGASAVLFCRTTCDLSGLTFRWFKENQSSAVGSRQSFIISSFNSSHSGRYSCEAQNQHGSQRSDSVSVAVEESRSALIWVVGGISAAVVLMSVILMVFIGLLIRRKRATPSEEQNPRGSAHSKTPGAPEDTYMTLDPKSRCSEYDTLDNMKRSCENTDDPEAQEAAYEDIV
ncbi:CXADR-like membrane protein [Carassius carassius]|uniref:CXADR-like membrane protein n=1 Tax=Carassius carassius TaxID=217509 RepID=UPI002868DB2F|nr:CXADR-like membrane protein [Carassius carassius]